VEPFCAAAEQSESSSRSRAEPRTEQARLPLPIADPPPTGPPAAVASSAAAAAAATPGAVAPRTPGPGRKAEEGKRTGEGGGAMRVRRPRWIFKTRRERQRNGDGRRDAMMLLSCVPGVIGEEKVASGSGEEAGKVVRESCVSCSNLS
jgi:hypothetical protein